MWSHNHSLNVHSYSLTNIIVKIPEGFDRTAAGRSTRAQMSQDLAKAINDGLTFYEEGLWLNDGEDEEGWIECTGSSASDHERTNVNIISQEDFAKIRQTKKDAPTYYQRPPAPPPTATNSTLPSPITKFVMPFVSWWVTLVWRCMPGILISFQRVPSSSYSLALIRRNSL